MRTLRVSLAFTVSLIPTKIAAINEGTPLNQVPVSESGYDGPVHSILTGKRNERDRRIVVERAPRYGIVGESRDVKFRVEDDGATGPVDVTISVDGTWM